MWSALAGDHLPPVGSTQGSADGPTSGPPPPPDSPADGATGDDGVRRSEGPTGKGTFGYEAPPVHVDGSPADPQVRQALTEAATSLADATRDAIERDNLNRNRAPQMAGAMVTPDGTIHSHTSMPPDRSVTPNREAQPHPYLGQILDDIRQSYADRGEFPPRWHGHCAEVALVSDRLYALEAAWISEGRPGSFGDYAADRLAGSVTTTHRIGDLQTGRHDVPHGELTPPCSSCAPMLDHFGIEHLGGEGPPTAPAGAPDPSGPSPSGPSPSGPSPSGPSPSGPSPSTDTGVAGPAGTPDGRMPGDAGGPGDVGALPSGPVDPTRPYGTPGGLDPVDPVDVSRMDAAALRDTDGQPQRHPDPHEGVWLEAVNDGGTQVPGRANNCADCLASFAATWYGDPTVAAPTSDHAAGAEVGARRRLEHVLGTTFTHYGDATGLSAIADQLRQAGPGSLAGVTGYWTGNGGHAFAMVNHDGTIYIVDPQSTTVDTSVPQWASTMDKVYGIVLDPQGVPVAPPSGLAATSSGTAGLPDLGIDADQSGRDGPRAELGPTDAGHSPEGPISPPDPVVREQAVDQIAHGLGITDPVAVQALHDAYDVVYTYHAPFMVEIVDRMLVDLRADVARNPDAVATFVGRDGHSLAVAARALDPDFFDAHGREIVLSRAVVEAAILDLERNAGMSFPELADFRQAAGKVDPADIPGAAAALENYLMRRGVPVGPGGEVILVDTSYKGTVQELLSAVFPDTSFQGRYAFFGASPHDPHPGTKTGYELHLDADESHGGRPLRTLPDADVMTFANADAIASIEETLHGDRTSPRGFGTDGVPAQQPQRTEPLPRGLNPVLVSPTLADPTVREAVKKINIVAIGDYAAHIADVRRSGGDPTGELRAGSDRFRAEVRRWVSHDPAVDPRLREVLDSFVRRADKGIVSALAGAIDDAALTPEQARAVWEAYDRQPTYADREAFVRDFMAAEDGLPPLGEIAGDQPAPAVLDSSMSSIRPAEQATAERLAADPAFAGRTFFAPPPPDPGHDWSDDLGRTYDALGDGTSAQYFDFEQFRRAIDAHLVKSNDFTVIDMTGYTTEQIELVRQYVDSLPARTSHGNTIVRVGF